MNGVSEKGRFAALESLRGIAAVMVVLTHFVNMFFPVALAGQNSGQAIHGGFELYLHGNPISVLFNGTFGVAIFFILSGFVLSIGFFSEKRKSIRIAKNYNQFLKRYWRLMIPALGSVIIAYLLLRFGLAYNRNAAEITGSAWLIDNWSNIQPNIWQALWQGTVGIFFGERSYNGVLWTMEWEFLGSLLVFAALALFGDKRNRRILYLIMGLALVHTYLVGFVIGIALADFYASHQLPKLTFWKTTALLVPVVYLGGFPIVGAETTHLYGWLAAISPNVYHWYFIGGAIAIWITLSNGAVQKFLSHKHLVAVGRHTFSIYLLHTLLFFTFTSYVTTVLAPHLPYKLTALVAFVSTIALLIPAVLLYSKYVDDKAIVFSKKIANAYKD